MVVAGVVEEGVARADAAFSLRDGSEMRIRSIEFIDPPREPGESALTFSYIDEQQLAMIAIDRPPAEAAFPWAKRMKLREPHAAASHLVEDDGLGPP